MTTQENQNTKFTSVELSKTRFTVPSSVVATQADSAGAPKMRSKTAPVIATNQPVVFENAQAAMAPTSVSTPATVLLSAMWRSDDRVHQTGELDKQSKKFTNKHAKDVSTAVERAKALSADGKEAYYACGEYLSANSRTAENAAGACAFWVDIDCGEDKAADGKGYRTEEVARLDLCRFCEAVCAPEPTHIVSSGSGLHAYWVLDSFVERAEWQCYARKLKGLTHALNFLADDTRTADIASVLRVPGTLNYKYNPPKPVVLLQSSSQFIEKALMLSKIDMAHQSLCPVVEANVQVKAVSGRSDISMVSALLKNISPDIGYKEWTSVGMAVNQETAGSEEGFDLYNDWSGLGKDYPGIAVMRTKWKSFETDRVDTYNLGTLINMAKAGGADLSSVIGSVGEQFELCDTVVINPASVSPVPEVIKPTIVENTGTVDADKRIARVNPLDKHTLRGKLAELEKMSLALVYVLSDMAILGQATVFYAWPNTGKTLIILYMLIEAIMCGRIDPTKLYYINMDDSHKGLTEKLALAEEHNFNILADGYEKFSANKFTGIMEEMIETDSAHGVIIVLDTLKKFTDVMDKTKSTNFGKLIRRFTLKGGTVIVLAHANKRADPEGKPIPGGTSDIKDDLDCAYVMWSHPVDPLSAMKTIQFENRKRRGNVVETAAYSYSTERGISYGELLASVQPVDDTQLDTLNKAEASKSDAEVIAVVTACICEGISKRTPLTSAIMRRANISKRAAEQIIEKYSGSDPTAHRWNFTRGERGAHMFFVLPPAQHVEAASPTPPAATPDSEII